MFELTPWRPMRELDVLRKEMDNLWENFFGDRGISLAKEGQWMPAVDIAETQDEVIVKAELAGIDPKEVDITFRGDVLTIQGEKKQKTDKKEENYHLIESRYGAFKRSIRMPVAVDADKIEASYEKGILKIVLPKKEEEKAKQIEVKAG